MKNERKKYFSPFNSLTSVYYTVIPPYVASYMMYPFYIIPSQVPDPFTGSRTGTILLLHLLPGSRIVIIVPILFHC